MEPLRERQLRFVVRSAGKRLVSDRRHQPSTVRELAARCQRPFAAKVVRIEDGKEKIHHLQYGAVAVWLPERPEKLLLVVVTGFGQEPLMLLTNLQPGVRDSEALWWIVGPALKRLGRGDSL